MATIATALSDQQLEAKLRELQTEAASFRKKLDDDTNKLAAARAEQRRIAEGIARGTVRESEAPRNQSEIDSIEIRIEGYNSVLADNRSKANELGQELGRRQAAAAKAAREKAYAELQEETTELAETIREELTRLITGPLAQFDANRVKLVLQFQDLGGEKVAEQFCRMLSSHPGPKDDPRIEPNIHIRRLLERGWQFFLGLPGGNLVLTVCSMRRRE